MNIEKKIKKVFCNNKIKKRQILQVSFNIVCEKIILENSDIYIAKYYQKKNPNFNAIIAESKSLKFLNELKKACSNLNLTMMSVSYDPFSKLDEIPKTPKQRYKIMTNEMPKNGKLSLNMMYQTCGTQINLDYTSEKDFTSKFKLCSFLVPISIAIFANSPLKENKLKNFE